MNAIKNYFKEWAGAIWLFSRYRNTTLAVLVMCLVTMVVRYNVSPYGPNGQMNIPRYFLISGIALFVVPILSGLLLGPSDRFGFRFGKVGTWIKDVGAAWFLLLVLILVFGRRDDFVRYYPMHRPASGQWTLTLFLYYEFSQFVYMFGWEFIFRGYLLFAVKKELGLVPAIIVQMLPFAFLHIGKPELETYGSVLAGLFLGLIAVRGNSFFPCVLLHFGVALTMDVFAALWKGILHFKL